MSFDNQLCVPVNHQSMQLSAATSVSPVQRSGTGRSTRNSTTALSSDIDSLTPQVILRSLRLHKYDRLFTNISVREVNVIVLLQCQVVN